MNSMRTLHIDLETRSAVDIQKSGVYRYAEDDQFDILLFGVSVDHGPIHVYDLACGDVIPDAIPSTEQLREAMEKVPMPTDAKEKPLWEGDEDEMARNCGLR